MKSRALTFASIFSAVVGLIGIIGAVVVLWLFLNGTLYSTPIIGDILSTFEGYATYVGIMAVGFSLVHLLIAALLWREKASGGYLAFFLAGVEMISYLSVIFIPTLALPMIVFLGVGSTLAILTITVWDELRLRTSRL